MNIEVHVICNVHVREHSPSGYSYENGVVSLVLIAEEHKMLNKKLDAKNTEILTFFKWRENMLGYLIDYKLGY